MLQAQYFRSVARISGLPEKQSNERTLAVRAHRLVHEAEGNLMLLWELSVLLHFLLQFSHLTTNQVVLCSMHGVATVTWPQPRATAKAGRLMT